MHLAQVIYYVIPAVDHNDVVTLAYSATTGKIVNENDAAPMATFAAEAVTNNVAGVAPTLSSAEVGTVDAFTVVLVFSVAVSATDYSLGFTVKKGGVGQTVDSFNHSAGDTIQLILHDAVANGNVITLDYSSVTGQVVNAADGEPLATFAGSAVTNNVA